MLNKKSFSHVHLKQEHYHSDSDTKDSSKYLLTFEHLLKSTERKETFVEYGLIIT